MRHILSITLLSFITIFSFGCKEYDDQLNAVTNEKFKDTVFKTFPTVNYVFVKVDGFENVTVMFGDKELFNAPAEKQQEVSNEVAQIVYGMYHANNDLKKGTLQFVAEENKVPDENEPKKEYDLKLESFKK